MGLGEPHRHWDSRSPSPYHHVSDAEDKKVMDLSTYHSPIHSSPMMVCCGSPSQQDTVLRLNVHPMHEPSSPAGSRGSSLSPQPSRTVITSVSSLQHPSSSSSPQPYRPNSMYYMQSPSLAGPIRPVTLNAASRHHTQVVPATSTRKKKLPQPIPEECKDDAYWERRKRNNESAKRSRELRRNKEVQTAERVNYLESENLQLRTEVAMLRNEVEKFRQLLIPKSSICSS